MEDWENDRRIFRYLKGNHEIFDLKFFKKRNL